MKYLIVGLGNPGEKYANTRHNIGFKTLDALALELDANFKTEKHADVAYAKFKGRFIVLIKPTTFMNLSGKAVSYWMQNERIPLENLLVVTDDIALPFGKLRLKGKGSDGGHNGLKDIERALSTPNYTRLRFGVGNDFAHGRQADYVLGEWSLEDSKDLPENISKATEFVKSFVSIGLAHTMSLLNNK